MTESTRPYDVDPLYQQAIAGFAGLLAQAEQAGEPEPTAMTLATCDGDGRVSARIVLLKAVDAAGFRFFTNYESAKAQQLAAHPQAALCFHWKRLREQVQVRVEGRVQRLPEADSDAYFASRPRGSQIGAWASRQSQTLPDRAAFEARYAEAEARYSGAEVPRPPHWGGYVLAPDRIEFWFGAEYRLHDRDLYERSGDGQWSRRNLYP
ncbi:MAG TPA: pyridoxamine 5'-phosphate oxidase [Dokdonella sp.]|uniref:pyridoxamine 5'-phosphate oxidase n=1 Tax=Dokdonella sp. TaxID=2291710 RepID=UPI002B88D253|nr:pyridoxamine 5'-phosphate oxidase [Dokdonella sp.]HUD43884.1 pyridoxamine 5'-phosphate oxidase [Dokdonella sp.]